MHSTKSTHLRMILSKIAIQVILRIPVFFHTAKYISEKLTNRIASFFPNIVQPYV